MPERTERELLQLARPALRHAELVDIARTNSPGKTQESVEKKWPPREAKAARFLAILRRDYGDDAFVRAVSLEQAGNNRRAQKEKGNNVIKTTDKAEILRALSLVEPNRRLQLMAEYGLKSELENEISLLIENDFVYFWQANRASSRYKSLIKTEVTHKEEPVLCFRNAKIWIDLDAWQAFIGWNAEQLASFAKKALVRLCSRHPADIDINGSWGIGAVGDILKKFNFDDKAFVQDVVETWMVRAYFMDGAYLFDMNPEFYQHYLGVPIKREYGSVQYNQKLINMVRDDTKVVNALVDRLASAGWSMEEIRQEFLRWLQIHVGHLNTNYHVGVASAKCFKYDDKDRAVLLHQMAPRMIKWVFEEDWWLSDPFLVNVLGRHGMYSANSVDDQVLYALHMTEALSKGFIGKCYHIHQLMGDSITKLPLSAFAPDAIEKAIESGRYGTAAALVQSFPDSVDIYCAEERFRPQVEAEFAAKRAEFEADLSGKSKLKNLKAKINRKVGQLTRNRRQQISELMSLAMTLKQRIALDYSLPYVHSLNKLC